VTHRHCVVRRTAPAQGFEIGLVLQIISHPLRDQAHRKLVYPSLQFHKGSPDFIGTHDETLSVAMRVHDPDRSPFKIDS